MDFQGTNQYRRRGRQNVAREKPRPRRHSRTAMSPLDLWKLFLSDQIIHEIVVHTNEKLLHFEIILQTKYCKTINTLAFIQVIFQEFTLSLI